MKKHYPLYAITILWPQVKEASTRIQTYANNEAITVICENGTVYSNMKINHTFVTLTIMEKLGKSTICIAMSVYKKRGTLFVPL